MSQTCLSNNKTASQRLRHPPNHEQECLRCLNLWLAVLLLLRSPVPGVHPCPSQMPQLPPTLGWMRSAKNMQNRGIETELGEPVSKRSWASQYRAQVGRASIKPERGRAAAPLIGTYRNL